MTEKTTIQQLLENAQSLQRGFEYAAGAASGDKSSIYREIKKSVDLTASAIAQQADLDRRLRNIERVLNLTGQEDDAEISSVRVNTMRLPR